MVEYIEKEKAFKALQDISANMLKGCGFKTPDVFTETSMITIEYALKELDILPVTKVVHCKDCKYYCAETQYSFPACACELILDEGGRLYPDENFYCAYGVTKT